MANETYSMISVPKQKDNAGRPQGRHAYILFIDVEDIALYQRDEKGVKMSSFTLKAGKKPIGVYHTPSTGNVYDTAEGEEDNKGYIHNVEFEHPGNSQEFLEFKENCINKGLLAISVPCDITEDAVIAGFPCCPLRFSEANGQNNKDGNKQTVKLATTVRKSVLGIIPRSLIPATDNDSINTILGIPGEQGV